MAAILQKTFSTYVFDSNFIEFCFFGFQLWLGADQAMTFDL